jgi:hypothetical protein
MFVEIPEKKKNKLEKGIIMFEILKKNKCKLQIIAV